MYLKEHTCEIIPLQNFPTLSHALSLIVMYFFLPCPHVHACSALLPASTRAPRTPPPPTLASPTRAREDFGDSDSLAEILNRDAANENPGGEGEGQRHQENDEGAELDVEGTPLEGKGLLELQTPL